MKRNPYWGALANILGVAIGLIMFFPIFWTFLTGLKSESDALATPPIFWFTPSLEKYLYALGGGDFLSFFANSATIIFVSTIAALVLGLPAAFASAFFPGKRAGHIQFFALSTRFTPGVAVIVPIYIAYIKLGLLDTRLGLGIMYVTLGVPMVLWLMGRFFREIPRELVEAALLDGANYLQVIWMVVLPMAIPGLVTTVFLIVIMNWNEFFFAANLVGRSAATLPIYMASFFTTMGETWAQMSAAATLAVLPILILGWFAAGGLAKRLTTDLT